MGIGYHMVEALIRESQHKPIRGDVVLIGRQTVYFSPESILDLLNQHGIDVKDHQSADPETGGLSNLNMPDFLGQKLVTLARSDRSAASFTSPGYDGHHRNCGKRT
jgi:hypothetical protein